MRHLPLLLLLVSFSVMAKPCGLQGSIDERVKDCAVTKGDFVLVAITEKGLEYYKDLRSGLIWGSRVTSDFNHYGSQRACTDDVSGYEGMPALKWRLPTINEFETAASHGMKTALQNMEYAYWSSTGEKARRSRKRNAPPARVFIWDAAEERTDTGDLKDSASVRCVAKD